MQSYWAEILPEVVECWHELSDNEQASLCKMNNFFCGLHFLIVLADVSSDMLKQWELLHSDDNAICTKSGTMRLIRTACKAFQKQCSEQAGCHIMFRAYLQSQGVLLFPIARFKGNRLILCFTMVVGYTFFIVTL